MSRVEKFFLPFFTALVLFLFFFRLGSNSLINWDEAYFATVARDMASRNDFLTGYFNGNPWFYEPPFLTWVLAVVFKFSHSEFWLRFFNAGCAFLIVVFVWLSTLMVYKNRLSAFFAAIVIASNIEFLFRSRQINVEIPLTLFLLATLYFLLKFSSQKQKVFLF